MYEYARAMTISTGRPIPSPIPIFDPKLSDDDVPREDCCADDVGGDIHTVVVLVVVDAATVVVVLMEVAVEVLVFSKIRIPGP